MRCYECGSEMLVQGKRWFCPSCGKTAALADQKARGGGEMTGIEEFRRLLMEDIASDDELARRGLLTDRGDEGRCVRQELLQRFDELCGKEEK